MQELEMSERLRKESLIGYSSGVKDSIYNESINSLSVLEKAFTERGHGGQGRGALVPLHLVQSLSTLAIAGFEDAGGFQEYKKGIPRNLERVWLLFTTALIHFVREQDSVDDEPIFFGCFEIPQWFIGESRSIEIFKYFE